MRLASVVYVVVLALSWSYLLNGAGMGMSVFHMTSLAFPLPSTPGERLEWGVYQSGIATLMMWWIMMLAMMLPGLARERAKLRLIAGYSVVWLLASVIATMIQFGLMHFGLLHQSMLWIADDVLSASVLVAVGLYQLSSLKAFSLHRCRSIAASPQNRDSGWQHGIHCVRSSGPLMLLLFVGGVMNLVWIVILTGVNTIERNVSEPIRFSRWVGTVCLMAGIYAIFIDPLRQI